MKINHLFYHNLADINVDLPHDESLGIVGVSGSGKTSFCEILASETTRRIILLLPRSEYLFIFPEQVISHWQTFGLQNLPLIRFLRKSDADTNPRSTVGTHSQVFKDIRRFFAKKHNTASEFFSFNFQQMWCPKCKGRGYFRGEVCDVCDGTRYSRDIQDYPIKLHRRNYSIASINQMSIEELLELKLEIGLSQNSIKVVEYLIRLGMGYLSLDRILGTLSGGELTRLYLAEFMLNTNDHLIIIDEMSHGLDNVSLQTLLREIHTLGENNQLWFIDHSQQVINHTSRTLCFGPASGKNGGKIISEYNPPEIVSRSKQNNDFAEQFIVNNLQCRNLDLKEFVFPRNALIGFTGISGSGKSTLINECIAKQFPKQYPKIDLVCISQKLHQNITGRSTIATYLGLLPHLLKIVSAKLKKKARTLCEVCDGSGEYEDGLACSACFGTGYSSDVLHQELKEGITFLSLFNQPIDSIVQYFSTNPVICKPLEQLALLGVGHLTLFRAVNSLSTGEFQCLHLIKQLSVATTSAKPMLITLDEPSRGLSQNILNQFVAFLIDNIG